ncbi:unnamed protein product [Moneuplotes crassus]|uniref:Glutathione S-transferase n=1 Tax=Euplotes crassus TaxID=5936 RepID=A0AAD1XX72_EUPCR|nr:unnamed protein product [Moneuplotes crassus]
MLKLYLNYISQPSKAVAVLCKMGGIQVEEIKVVLKNHQHRKSDFMKVNPLGTVPILIDGDDKIVESNAILKYLCRKYDLSKDLYPRGDPLSLAKVDATLDLNSHTVRPTIMPYVQQSVFRIVLGMGPCEEKRMKFITKGAHSTLKRLDWILSEPEIPFFTLNTKTIADLQIFEELHFMHELSDIKMHQYKHLGAWYDKMFKKEEIQHYHKLMEEQVNEDFGTDFKFTAT